MQCPCHFLAVVVIQVLFGLCQDHLFMLSMSSIDLTIEIQFLFWVLLRADLNPLLVAWSEMILSGAHENIFISTNIKHFVL